MTLEEKIKESRSFYECKYGLDSWQWNDEGIVYAIQDYLSSYEMTDADWEFAESNNIDDICKAEESDNENEHLP